MSDVSRLKRQEIVGALRIGSVPKRGLELYAVGMQRFERAVDEELGRAAAGQGVFKAVRGEFGAGKTFLARWLEHRAQLAGFATAVVQISGDTPLYRMEKVYRRALEGLRTRESDSGAFRQLVERWFFGLEEEVLGEGNVSESDPAALAKATGDRLEQRLMAVSATQPQFAAALRACHTARLHGDNATAEGLFAWLMAQPNVGADIKRAAGLKGDVDNFGAGGFFRGLLELLRQTGRKGLLLVLDECEIIQRVRDDLREKSLNALRQLIDDLDAGRYPGMYVLVTGTPQFFEGPLGIKKLPPLAQRLHVDFSGDPQFESTRAPQIRLHPFDLDKLVEAGRKVRDLYPAHVPAAIAAKVDEPLLSDIARSVAGQLGQQIGVAPRLYLRKLVQLLDKVDEFEAFDPRSELDIPLDTTGMRPEEMVAAGRVQTVDDIALELGKGSEE